MTEAFRARLAALGYRSYRDYLRSEHWRAKKAEYRASALPQECLVCRDLRFDLHHRSYVRIGAELLNDLLPLCRGCHRRVHEYERLHGTRVQETHAIIRRAFGFTRAQVRARFEMFTLPGVGDNYDWVPGERRRRVRKRKTWADLPIKYKFGEPNKVFIMGAIATRRMAEREAAAASRRAENRRKMGIE